MTHNVLLEYPKTDYMKFNEHCVYDLLPSCLSSIPLSIHHLLPSLSPYSPQLLPFTSSFLSLPPSTHTVAL